MTNTTAPKKKWYQSKTVWVSILTFVYGIVAFFYPELAVDGGVIASVGGIVFFILRTLTGVEITFGDIDGK